MKAKAIKTFRDRYTKELYEKDSVFDVSEERAAEMNAAHPYPLVEILNEECGQKPLYRMNKDELLSVANKNGIEVPDGLTNKDIRELIERSEK